MSWFAIRKKQKNERKGGKGDLKDAENQQTSLYRPPSNGSMDENGRPTPSPTLQSQQQSQSSREPSSSPNYGYRPLDKTDKKPSVQDTRELFESLSNKSLTASPEHPSLKRSSPEKTSSPNRYSSLTTPTHELRSSSRRKRYSGISMTSNSSLTGAAGVVSTPTSSYTPQINIDNSFEMKLEVGKEKEFPDVTLKLPPLQTSRVRHRTVTSLKNPVIGGFGFNLRKAFQPHPDDPEKPLLVHLVEPRPNYFGPLMTGDRILEVNGENVENSPHERVVELIKSSGEYVEMKVASVPELMELNERGVFDDTGAATVTTNNRMGSLARKSGRPGVGTLRKTAAQRRQSGFQAKSESQVDAEKEMLKQEKVWVVHRQGFSLGVVDLAPKSMSSLATHINVIRSHGKRIRLLDSEDFLEVDDEDLEKANPSSLDRVEDLVELVHINESSVLHVLRQRYGSSLIHTFVGRHLIVINPIRPLSLYSDRVKEMFRGCRREDMPPHIFAAGQQAYYKMLQSSTDQSLVLMGLSGSGKTFNARYLLQYLATIGQVENGPVTCPKMDAVQLLLHTFTSAATFLNPQATRCSCLYSLEFDSPGSLTAASVRTFLLEKTRVALRPEGEQNFNILYQLIAGADDTLRKDLLLDVHPGTEETNHYVDPYKEHQQIDSAACVWDLIQNCLGLLNIANDEALGLWSLLGAIYHLGFAGVKQGTGRSTDRFVNPSAAQRAASLLGIPHEELAKDIFNPPRGTSSRLSSFLSSMSPSPTVSDTSSINLSIGSFSISPGTARANRSFSLDAFVMGLYEYALNTLVLLINRSLHPSTQQSKGKYFIHVLDTPGFQHRELAGCSEGTSFDDLCMNYTRERLQMLFHDFSFTSEQDRYIQDGIDWTFPEIVMSPLSIIDVIDKHIPQRHAQGIQGLSDFSDKPDRPGILWILEEESTFPASNDVTFLERIQTVHGEPDVFGDTTVKVNMEKGQFTILHCQRSLPVNYDIAGWRQRAREHPSTRVVGQVLAESKKSAIISLFQGRGVASLSSGTQSTSNLATDTTALKVGRTMSFSNPTAGIKKSSICLRTKFQLDFLIDIMRKTEQWYVHCLLSQPPHNLPGAIIPPDTTEVKDVAPYGHIDVPLVRAQLRRGDIISAARMFKQGFPDHVLYPAFRRRYMVLLQPEEKASLPETDKDAAEFILSGLEIDRASYRLGLSQVFFRAGHMSILERQVEERTHEMMVNFQAHIRGYLGRLLRDKLELQHSAAHVIQRNVIQADVINNWMWWKMYQKIKPLLQVWKAGEEVKAKQSEIQTLKSKLENTESERDVLKESELRLNSKVAELTAQLQEAQATAQHASDILEQQDLEKRELLEQNQDITVSEQELIQQNEKLQWQVAELTILANIKKSEGDLGNGDGGSGEDSEAVLEKYWETRRELEALRQRMSTERDDEIDRLQHIKKSLEKRLADADAEMEDMRRNLTQVRKKASKYSSEVNDMKLLLENQQARNEELEKKQRKFDSDISNANSLVKQEQIEKERFEREKKIYEVEKTDLEEKHKKLQQSFQDLEKEKSEMEAEFIRRGRSSDAESEIASLKRMKKDLESKIEELEDEVDELNIKMDTLQQSKTRLELNQQSLKSQHQKELDAREDDLEQLKSTMNKKLKAMEQQLEEEHESKQQAIRAKREIEREYNEAQSRVAIDPEVEKKLKKQVKKFRALLKDAQDELEHERETKNNPAALRSLRSQLEDYEMREVAAAKAQKRLQSDIDELQAQLDDNTRVKIELESHVSELQREKADLESRLEEEQDEVEQLVAKQRQNISQLGNVQHQLTEANYKIEELEGEKQSIENKLNKLQHRISELENDDTKQEKEASELKVRELEQKLELERSTIKRQEALVARLRGQLERLQNEKAEDSNSKSNEAMKRLQKQMRDLREELQESEKREQEQNKKRRAAETQLSDMEAQLQTVTADFKYAQKRIESLQGALTAEGAGSEYEDEDYEDDTPRSHPSHKAKKLTKTSKKTRGTEDTFGDSSDGSYHIGEFGEGDSSSDEQMARLEARKKQRQKEMTDLHEEADDLDDIDQKYLSKSKKKSVLLDDDKDMDDGHYESRKKSNWSDEEEAGKTRAKTSSHASKDDDGNIDDDDITPKKKYNWRELLSDNEDNGDDTKQSRPVRKNFDISDGENDSDDDDVSAFSSKGKKRYDLSDEDAKTTTKQSAKSKYSSTLSSDDDDILKKDRYKTKSKHEDTNPTDKKSSWRSKYDISDEDQPITKTLSSKSKAEGSDDEYIPKRSYRKYMDSDEGEGDTTKSRKKSLEENSRSRVKKSWETSSDDEDYKPKPRSAKLSSLLNDDSDDGDIPPRSRSRKNVDYVSDDDDDDMPILKHAPKQNSVDSTPTRKSNISGKAVDSSPSKKDVKFDKDVDDDNESYKSSRRRRERRRSRLSNTGTSPEDSPKRSSLK